MVPPFQVLISLSGPGRTHLRQGRVSLRSGKRPLSPDPGLVHADIFNTAALPPAVGGVDFAVLSLHHHRILISSVVDVVVFPNEALAHLNDPLIGPGPAAVVGDGEGHGAALVGPYRPGGIVVKEQRVVDDDQAPAL